ncbi:MAG TPA: DHH family phosphoesterase [Anaerohalosphaeraceae bacterium]|nr:DHH family phosphoesterase [Anaerohalosphaeraceae bacterium]
MGTCSSAVRKTRKKLASLRDIFKGNQTLLIVLQNSPDPDSIASAMVLRKLANSLADIQCSLVYGGRIGRAENRALIHYLSVNLREASEIDFHGYDLIAMVDTQPWAGNNCLPAEMEPDIVIDHHKCRRSTRQCRFTDIRSRYGATVTILYEYLQAAGIEIDSMLATAILYAIRSDTQDFGRDTTQADLDAVMAVYPLANKRILGQIQRGRVERNYFQTLSDGLRNARVCGPAIVTGLGKVENPDMIGEMADLLLRDEATDWAVCYGFFEGRLLISIRTSAEPPRADKVIRHMIGRKGSGGGHPSYAGGQIPLESDEPRQIRRLERRILKRFLESVGAAGAKEEKLIQS